MPAAPETQTAALLGARYQLGACIGQGGAARVYRADDVMLGRTVAVKLMQADAEALAAPTRVRNEIAVLASLAHPSLVELYDANMEPGQPCYLVMEFIDGPTLAARLHEGALTGAEVTALARDLASALHTVHSAGVVHRDIKPANVLLAPAVLPGADFRAKLADFGVAFLLDTTRVTNPGTIVGTAAYLPPEQVRGEAATPPGDIYGLGLVLLEAITGERAFPKATGPGAVMARLFDSPQIPEWLDQGWSDLLARMTTTEPTERPTALEVAEAAAGLPSPVRPAGSATEAGDVTAVMPVAATTQLPSGSDSIAAPRRGHTAQGPAKIAAAAAAAILCIVLAFWATATGAESATQEPRLAGSVFGRAAPPSSDSGVDAPSDEVANVPDPKTDKRTEKAAEQARKDDKKADKGSGNDD